MSLAVTSMVISLLAAGRAAHAQSSEAEALFNTGNELMAKGRLAEACDSLEASNRIEPTAGTLIQLGKCREQNDQLASAWSTYKEALTRVKDPGKRRRANSQVTALAPRLSYLTISVSNHSLIEGLTLTCGETPFEMARWNHALPIDGGDYIITARAPGHNEWRTTAHVAVEHDKVVVEVPRLDAAERGEVAAEVTTLEDPGKVTLPPAPPATLPAGSRSPVEPGDAAVAHPGGFTTRRKISVAIAGVSVASAIAAATLGIEARARQHDAASLCPDLARPCTRAAEANALVRSGNMRAFEANVAFGIVAATTIGAGVLWFTGIPDEGTGAHASIVPYIASSEFGLAIIERF